MLLGAGVVLFARGLWIAAPVLGIVAILVDGLEGVRTVVAALGLVAVAMVGGACAGLAYTLVGQRVRHLRAVGPSLAGITSLWPYYLAVMGILEWQEGSGYWTSSDTPFLVGFFVVHGGLVGWVLFRD